MSILVIAPHPDDEVLGVGGTMAKHIAAGEQVSVGIVTRGNPGVFPDEQVATVRAEAKAAHEWLGVSRTRFSDDIPAPGMDTVPQHDVVNLIRTWLDELQPKTLYIPHRGDVHIDHRLTFEAALVAVRPGYSSVRRVLAYETLSETEWSTATVQDAFLPNVFVNITAYLPDKLAAMNCYKSQSKEFPNPRSAQSIEALARHRGATIQAPAAEAFSLVREIQA